MARPDAGEFGAWVGRKDRTGQQSPHGLRSRSRPRTAARNHNLTSDDHDTADRAWNEPWAATRPVKLTAAVGQDAGHLARTHALRGADAVHLASALAISDPDLVIAVWDRHLLAGARAAGLRVAPAQL